MRRNFMDSIVPAITRLPTARASSAVDTGLPKCHEHPVVAAEGRSMPTGAEAYRVRVSFGVSRRTRFPQGRPVQSRTLLQSARCRPGSAEREKALNPLVAVLRAAGEG